MSKLAPPVETALSMWRTRTANGVADAPSGGETLVVYVTHEGDLQPLVAAGLTPGFNQQGMVSGRIAFRDLERLAAVPSVVYIEKEPSVRPLLDGTVAEMRVPWKVPPTTPWPGKGAGVIVAVIDTGIDIFHESFLKTDGTSRILELWDQSAQTGGSPPPPGFDQQAGRVFSQAQINAGITAGAPFASIDNNGHGTHVAGIAAGNGKQDDRCSTPGTYVGVAPEADLVIVKAISLPAGSNANTGDALRWASGVRAQTTLNGAITAAATTITVSAATGFPTSGSYRLRIGTERLQVTAGQGTLTWTVTRGVDGTTAATHANGDIVQQVADKPVVVNCSFGSSTGPHDGTGGLDRMVDAVLRPTGGVPPGVAIVVSAGNQGDSEIHDSGTVNGNSSVTKSFRIPSGSAEDDELDIWYNGDATLNITLTAPANPDQPGPLTVGPVAPGGAGSPFTIGAMTIHVSSDTTPSVLHSNQKNINVGFSVVTRTSLNGAITAAATSISVNAFAGFPTSGSYRIKIGGETLLVTAGQGTPTWTVTRGVDGTTASAHANGAGVKQVATLVIRPGEWQLTLTTTTAVAANWRAWFATSHGDAFPTFRLESESNVVDRRRSDTIGEPGSSVNAITVANYSDGDGLISSDSSRGGTPPVQQPWQAAAAHVVGDHVIPTGAQTGFRYRCTTAGTSGGTEPTFPTTLGQTVADGGVVWESVGALVHELKPTIAAPGSGVAAPRSQNDPKSNSSCCDQKVIDKSGTSMSSPHVAGLVALMLQKNGTLNFEQIRGHLQRTTRIDGIPAGEVPPVFDALLNIRAGHIWGAGKVNAAQALADIPEAAGGGGGGGGGGGDHFYELGEDEWGYTPHTVFSRLGEWRTLVGPRPGLMLMASLISEHFDEVLRLINHNRKVGTVWRREGGPLLARHLLFSHQSPVTPLPAAIDGCNVRGLIRKFIPILKRFGGTKLKQDIDRYASFAHEWPGATVESLDAWALAVKGKA